MTHQTPHLAPSAGSKVLRESSPHRTAFVCLDPAVPVAGRVRATRRTEAVLGTLTRLGHGPQLFSPSIREVSTEPTGPAGTDRFQLEPEFDIRGVEEAGLALNAPLRRGLEAFVEDNPAAVPVDLLYERHSRWSYAGLEWARARGIPSVLEVDASLFDEPEVFSDPLHQEAARVVAWRAVSAATTTIATSEGVAEWVRSLGVPDLHLHVVPEGADPKRFATVAAAVPTSCLPGAALTIGFVGSLHPWYGLPALFEAFAHLADRRAADRLLILGNGPERLFFDQLAIDLGIAAQVAWLSEDPPDVEVDCLAHMDIVVAPYLAPAADRDGLGQLFEYMAAARPIIATGLNPIRAVLQHGRSALLVPPEDPIGIATAIGILRRNPALRMHLARCARAALRDRHTWDHVVQTILGHLRSDTASVRSEETSFLDGRKTFRPGGCLRLE